jgi:phosphomannomutase
MNTKIFKAYDVRGLYPQDINSDVVTKIIPGFLKLIERGTIVVAHDGRHGSVELAKTLEVELAKNEGCHVTMVGLSTTPMFYFLVCDLSAAGGVMVTASHNPKEYNGLKTVRKDALPISGIELRDALA